jgi:hypothetical protein
VHDISAHVFGKNELDVVVFARFEGDLRLARAMWAGVVRFTINCSDSTAFSPPSLGQPLTSTKK